MPGDRGDESRAERAVGLSRRSFLTSSGVACAGAVVLEAAIPHIVGARAEAAECAALGPGAVPLGLEVNGQTWTVAVPPHMTLAEVLRGPLGLTGTKIGCDRGACAACTA
jgi:hypothetical protein